MNKKPGPARIKSFPSSLLLSLLLVTSCAPKALPPRITYALGTVCAINLYDEGTKEIYDEMAEALNALEHTFSINVPDSEVVRINVGAGKEAVRVSPEVIYVVKMAKYFAEKSGGAFDPTIGPVSLLWGVGSEDARLPSQEEIDARLPLVDYRKIIIDEEARTVFLETEGMILDLGGIAKGYAADCLVQIAQNHGLLRAIIDLGGNVYVWGTKKDGAKWKVGVKDPENPGGEPAASLEIDENSVVTSGMYERFFEEGGVRYHHILSPKTGYPVFNGVLSFTIVSRSSLAADALSTTVFILGKEAGLAFLEAGFPEIGVQAEGLLIAGDHTVSATRGLAPAVTVTGKSYR